MERDEICLEIQARFYGLGRRSRLAPLLIMQSGGTAVLSGGNAACVSSPGVQILPGQSRKTTKNELLNF